MLVLRLLLLSNAAAVAAVAYATSKCATAVAGAFGTEVLILRYC